MELVAELDASSGSYEFDLVTVWRSDDGELWAGSDAGCSCYAPYEDWMFPQDYVRVISVNDVRPLVDAKTFTSDWSASKPADVVVFYNKVRSALNA